MINLEETLAKQLDHLKKMGLGDNARLFIIRPDADKGYTPVAEVEDGWTLEDGDLGQPQTLCVVKHNDWVTEDMLKNPGNLFCIDNRVYDVVGGFETGHPGRSTPLSEWKWSVSPTNETFDPGEMMRTVDGEIIYDLDGNIMFTVGD